MSPVIHLIVQYCNDPRPGRQAEYDYCLRRNLANPAIKIVHNFVEPQTVVPREFREHPKYLEHPLARWMTYRDAFDFANQELPGEIICIANLDIFLDDATTDWMGAATLLRTDVVLCLSRFEFDLPGFTWKDPKLSESAFAVSQDAWVFLAPLQVPDCDFELGILGCDNAIAERIKRAGRIPVNSPNQFRIFHYDRCRGKSFANQADVHAVERASRHEKHPEEQGQYLVPDFEQVKSVDAILNTLRVTDLQRYRVICDSLSRFYTLGNRTEAAPPPDASGRLDPKNIRHVVFYNHWHNGDIYLSRAIVEELIRTFPDKTFAYAHALAPDLLADIDRLAFDPAVLSKLPMQAPYLFDATTQTAYVNTWIGVHGIANVHQRGGVSIQLLHELISPTIRQVFGIEPLPLAQCLPSPRFERFPVQGVDQFVKQDGRRKVFLSNGIFHSNQSADFDFTPLIDSLAANNPDVLFIPTNATPIRRKNVVHSAGIIRKGASDLNENGYLSTFCDVIIGRSSGAYTFCLNAANIRSAKTFVGLVNYPVEASLGFNAPLFSPKCSFIVSNDYRDTAMLELLQRTLDGALNTASSS